MSRLRELPLSAFPCRALPRFSLSALIGILLAIRFLIAGSIFPPMLAHTAFDVIVGIWLADGLLRG